MLRELQAKVASVYSKCGLESGANPSTLGMLKELEEHLEKLLSAIEEMPEDYVQQAEKEKERDRRERVRRARIEQDKQRYEEKLKKSLDRAQAPVERKPGKQVSSLLIFEY